MSLDLIAFGCIFLFTIPYALELSVCVGVVGCVCPIPSKVLCTGAAYFLLMKSDPKSDSSSNYTTDFMSWDIFRTATLLGGN